MSSLDVSDPVIFMAYDAVAQNNPLRWFLLAYGNKPNQLRLCASGPGDIEELQTHITPGNIHYGVFREHNNDSILCISLAVIPDSVRGVHRARAVVHANAISSMFKTHQMLTASSAEGITVAALRNALRLLPRTTAMTPGPGSTEPTNTDSALLQPLMQPSSGLSQPSFGSFPLPPSVSIVPLGSTMPTPLNPDAMPPQARSHRKAPPRLSMSPTVKGPAPDREHRRTGSSSRTSSGQSPVPHAEAPSPPALHSPPASSPPAHPSSSSPSIPQFANDSLTTVPTSPHAPIMDVVAPSDSRAHASWLAKQEVPLPPPPPAEPQPEHNYEPPLEPRSAFAPNSAFDSDDESSEVDYGVPMHGPLSEITGPAMNTAPAPAPASPIGSIPSEPSAHSRASSMRKHSPVREPSPPPRRDEHDSAVANGALSSASVPRTPAQEEASRARNGGTMQVEWTVDVEDSSHPPTPPAKTAPAAKDSLREDPSAREMTPPTGASNLGSLVTRQRAATESRVSGITQEAHDTPTSAADATHRRIASQSTYDVSPPAARSRFLERASPETLAEEQRLATLDEERRRRAAERAQREREERAEEEARERAFTERKERERVRRLELARQAEMRRAEERQREEDARAEREAKEARERQARAAKDREARARAQQRIEGSASGMDLLTGFVTLEMASVWRRRYFRLSTESWQFFRSDKDEAQPVHEIELARIRALREWNEGYEELEAIPHSFAVEFTDDGPWQFFADSAEDKEILLGLLNQAAGL